MFEGLKVRQIKLMFGLAATLMTLGANQAWSGETSYLYDVHGQVTSVTRSSGATTYTYDNAGNRTQVTGPGASLAMTTATSAKSSSTTAMDEELAADVARANAQQASLKKLSPIAAPASRNSYAPLPGVAAAIAKANAAVPGS